MNCTECKLAKCHEVALYWQIPFSSETEVSCPYNIR